ncbi:probable BOI-related E3 ubiquitin-protein ligase 2 isoform X2 [Malania oleifera]|uniref:probable BOI-related E3 ubiquitin-protein ligase 2 isoform X2 n=1 Tax=Malania oleifera TaxID=397392 RepID=UPI0025ADF0A7|nr:probable BOI-related E3 ubiquitin-protein ligase 2 isoform X2 [Malania oleifera]
MVVEAEVCAKDHLGFGMGTGLLDWSVTNPVLGFGDDACFGIHQLHQFQGIQNLGFDSVNDLGASSSTTPTGNEQFLSMALSQHLAALLEKQGQEINLILQLQSQRLRSILQAQRNRELAVILQIMESKLMNLLKQRDVDLEEATKKAENLQGCLRELEIENEAWQRAAKQNEATVMDLNRALEQAKESAFFNPAEDEESSNRKEVNTQKTKRMACKRCHSRNSCVVFFPCRHLCSCKSCEAFLGLCPVCTASKKASLEVFIA